MQVGGPLDAVPAALVACWLQAARGWETVQRLQAARLPAGLPVAAARPGCPGGLLVAAGGGLLVVAVARGWERPDDCSRPGPKRIHPAARLCAGHTTRILYAPIYQGI